MFERAAELQPTDFRSLCFAAMEYLKLERHKEARAATQRCLERVEAEIKARPDNAQALCFGAWALACTGQKAQGDALVAQAAVIDPDDCFMQYNIACVYSVLGRIDAAIDHLDKTLARTTASSARWYVEWTKQDTDFDPLRMRPRFQALLAQLESRASQQTQ